jgi:hypothetical protein
MSPEALRNFLCQGYLAVSVVKLSPASVENVQNPDTVSRESLVPYASSQAGYSVPNISLSESQKGR